MNFVIGIIGLVSFGKFIPYNDNEITYVYSRSLLVFGIIMVVNLKICKLFKDQYDFGIKY